MAVRTRETFVYRFDPTGPDAYWLARRLVEQWLGQQYVRADAVGDLLVVLTELCATKAAGTYLTVTAEVRGDTVELAVESPTASLLEPPAGDLRVAAALCDELVLRVRPDVTLVTARRGQAVLPDSVG